MHPIPSHNGEYQSLYENRTHKRFAFINIAQNPEVKMDRINCHLERNRIQHWRVRDVE